MSSGRINGLLDARRETFLLKQELDNTYKRYRSALSIMPLDFHGDASKYMLIRFSGYIEQLFHKSITGYIKANNNKSVASFALSGFKRAPNMKSKQLEALITKFENDWEQSLKLFLQKDNNSDNINTLLEFRNKIAHGESYSGSAPQLITYKVLVDDIHKWVMNTILK